MARIAVVTLPLAGHFNPMTVVIRELMARGHEICVFGPPDMRELLDDDIHFQCIASDHFPYGRLDAFVSDLRKMTGLSGLKTLIDSIAELSSAYAQHLPAALRAWQADSLIHDQLEPAAGLVAKMLTRERGGRFTHISLAAALPMNREPDVPPPYLGWTYHGNAYGRWVNQGGYRVVDWLMKPQNDVLAKAATRFGLPLPESGQWDMSSCASERCDLSQSVPLLDYPRKRHGAPSYIGPLRAETGSTHFATYADIEKERDGRSLIYGSLGTLMGGRVKMFQSMAVACEANNYQLIIAHGGNLPEGTELPSSVICRDFVDQADILKHADAAILNGGYNTVLDAMQAGKPILVWPIAFEQSAIASRVARLGAGQRVSRFRSLASDLAKITQEASFRKRAEICARQIRFAGGVKRAADYIERDLPMPHKPIMASTGSF